MIKQSLKCYRDYFESDLEDDFEIIEASNGNEAVDLLRYKAVDLLITDICMPEMNGIELVDKLRASGFSMLRTQ